MNEVISVVIELDDDLDIGVIIIIGLVKVFVVGVDIKEMVDLMFVDVFIVDFFVIWGKLVVVCILMIVVVVGYVFGGGCELVMMCDVLIVVDIVKFG